MPTRVYLFRIFSNPTKIKMNAPSMGGGGAGWPPFFMRGPIVGTYALLYMHYAFICKIALL